MTTSFKALETSDNGINWYELNGVDYGTNVEFESEVIGVTEDNKILDCDGIPCTEGDHYTIAVRNTLNI